MSLEARVTALSQALGADYKALLAAIGTPEQHNASNSNQTGFASDTYLAGSTVPFVTGKVKVGTKFRCKFNVVKTAAGVVAPTVIVRVGTAGAIADTARATITFAAQTAAIDEGAFEIECAFRAAGSTAVLQAMGTLGHRLATTGLSTANHSVAVATSGTFDVTAANLKIGLSVNAGNSSAWTVNLVTAELMNLAA